MAAPETVRIFTVDQQTPLPGALEGVLVRVFDSSGTTLITAATSALVGSDAIADFTVDGDDPAIEYIIRLFKAGVGFDGFLGDDNKTPQKISVWSPPASAPNGNNDFQVKGETFSLPTAVDAHLCRCSGFFKRADGLLYRNLDISFVPQFKPVIVDGYGVMPKTIESRTDEGGYLQIDLYRNGEYRAYVESLEDKPRCIVVPEVSSFSLVDLLFPKVGQVVFDPTSVSLDVGEAIDVIPTVTGTDLRELDGAAVTDVEYVVGDLGVATVSVLNDKLIVTGVSAGSTDVTVQRCDESIVVVPDADIVCTPLAITVA